MLKKLLFFVVAFAFALPIVAQHQRRVLIEEFTNASCGPCAAQNPAFNATVKANEQYLTPIKYQTSWPGFDPMNQQTQPEVLPRVQYYGVTGVPNGRQNGILEIFPMTSYNAATIQAAYNTLTPVTIELSHEINATYDTIHITVAVKSDEELTGNLRLRVAVLEEEILFETAPGSNGEKDFFQIMRKMLPNSAGTETGAFEAEEVKEYSFSWALRNIYDLNQLCVAAWLQNDATKEVYQSERTFPKGDIPGLGIKIPSASGFACESGVSPSFTMTNTSTEPLTSAEMRWRVGTGAWNNYSWTGDLGPGESEVITLTEVTITQSGLVNVSVEPLASNNGIQTNMVNPVSTLQIRALLGAPSSTPFEQGFQMVAFPPAGWSSESVTVGTATHGWKLFTGGGASSTRSARCNFFDYATGLATLTTPKLDLSQADGVTTLTFDHAYAYYSSTFFDSLRVQISNDCGATWQTLFHDGKDGLSTAPPQTGAFTPTASQWANNSFDISQFNGSDQVLIRFVGETGYGNHLYIDNVNVTALVSVKELALNTFSIRPNPTRDATQVFFGLEKPESIQLSVFNAQGTLMQTKHLGDLPSGEHTVRLDANNLPAGSYRVVLQGKEGVATALWMIVK
ncbi:MAG: Omp28-related outer membrane protein [Saprospiraceae bacterium]|nr:Omp28-related outer membrane protein [Saprospiraceae bacterium]